MPAIKDVQARYPNADSVGGRIICYYQGKHYDLGANIGDGMMSLSPDGERLMAPEPILEDPKKQPLKLPPRGMIKTG